MQKDPRRHGFFMRLTFFVFLSFLPCYCMTVEDRLCDYVIAAKY